MVEAGFEPRSLALDLKANYIAFPPHLKFEDNLVPAWQQTSSTSSYVLPSLEAKYQQIILTFYLTRFKA